MPPYRKRYTKKPYRKYTNKRRGMSLTAKVNKLIKTTKPEIKSSDNSVTYSPDVNGLITSGNTISQGTQNGQRVGDSVFMRNFECRMQIVNNSTTTTLTRIIFYWDYQNSVSSVANVLQTVGTQLGPLSPYNRSFRRQYKVLYDKTFTTDSVNKGQIVLKINRKVNAKQTYQASTATPSKGELRILTITDVALANAPAVDLYLRQYYTDV